MWRATARGRVDAARRTIQTMQTFYGGSEPRGSDDGGRRGDLGYAVQPRPPAMIFFTCRRRWNANRPLVYSTRGCVPAWADLDTTGCHVCHEGETEARRVSGSSLLFDLLTYMVVYLVYGWFGREFSVPSVGDSQQLLNVDLADEILWSSGAALVFSLKGHYVRRMGTCVFRNR